MEMDMNFLFRIVRVDMDGFNGREHHPQPSDVGLLVVPVHMDTMTNDGDCDTAIDDEGTIEPWLVDLITEGGGPEHPYFRVWTCLTSDGRTLDLMDFEVEIPKW